MALGLAEALEQAATKLPRRADSIRPANGDPQRLLELLDTDGAAEVLGWLLQHQVGAAEELVEAWCADFERGTEALLQIKTEGLPKPARKLLRRAHHRLRSRGVALPDEAPVQMVATLPSLGDDLDEALLSPVDPRGSRAAYLVETNPAGGARMFELILDEARGVVELEVYTSGRRQVRKFLREFSRRDRFRAIAAPPESVRALVRRIAAAQPTERPLPRGFAEWRSRVAEAPADTPTPGGLARGALGDGDGSSGGRVAKLIDAGDLGPWPPDAAILRPLAEKIAEIGESPIVVSGARRRARAQEVVDTFLVELFAGDFAGITAFRFEESAYMYWKDDREDDARACLATATAFRASAPADTAVARALAESWLGPVLSKLDEGNEDEQGESVLVKP